LLDLFCSEFHLTDKESSNLLISSSHLLGNGDEAQDNVAKVFERSMENFTDSQMKSSQELIRKAAGDLEKRPEETHKIIHDVQKAFESVSKTQDW
jgi:hypothetical protein